MRTLYDRLDRNDGLLGTSAITEETGLTKREITDWAEENDVPCVDGTYVFRSRDVSALVEWLEDHAEEDESEVEEEEDEEDDD